MLAVANYELYELQKCGEISEAMDEMISYTTGFMGIVSTAVVFLLAVVGVYIGYFILRKHFEHANVRNAA